MGTAGGVLSSLKALPRKIFGSRNDRLLKVYRRQVPPINEFESAARGDYDARYAQRMAGEKPDELEPAARTELLFRVRHELSDDLRQKSSQLKERFTGYVQPLHDWWRELTPQQRAESYFRAEYRKRHGRIMQTLDQEGLTSEAMSIIREASRRAQNHRHFDCQLVGGRVLYEGRIAEMRTGEGKTIVCHLAAFVRVLTGHKVHIITVNDYLVKRDAEFAQPIFGLLDISVGYIQAQMDPSGREGQRQRAYGCDITYGTNSEFGFDYLRDNMKTQLAEQVQGRLDFVIVDEVDSILIDEARTPLIISGPARDDVSRYPRANKVAEELVRRQITWDRKLTDTIHRYNGDSKSIPKLDDAMSILGYREKRGDKSKPAKEPVADGGSHETGGEDLSARATLGPDFLSDDHVEAIQFYQQSELKMPVAECYQRFFIVQTERKQVGITHEGVSIAQELLDVGSLYSGDNMEWPHLIENALRAHKVYARDRDYVVQDGQVIIVDPFTGRLMHGRQWSDGLHQAVEAKEAVRVKEETQTLATITIQNFIKLYLEKAGMTGTAMTEATEFDKIYGLDVVEIPTNRPVNRVDHNDKMYRDEQQKYDAIVEEIHEVHRRGRPADPFMMADVFTALRPILQRLGKDTARVDEALRQFNSAEMGDVKVIRFMLEVYDEMLGDIVHGRPVLVGTTSVENSEKLSRLLSNRYGIDHEVLNAKNHAREAEIVAKAGYLSPPPSGADKAPRGHVTIATNMAGRGTDIKLGVGVVFEKCKVPANPPEGARTSPLYPVGITKCCIRCEEYDPATNCAHCFKPKLDNRFPEVGRKICSLNVPCGLHIIGTERHEARRIDNQLRGRAGRQGDPGSSRFFLSLQDDLLKLFMSDWMLRMMEKLGFSEGVSLEDKRLSKGIERAQRKVEERNFSTRKHLLEWDEPMDFQRKDFYTARQRILEERDLPGLIFDTIDTAIDSTVNDYLKPNFVKRCIAEWFRSQLDMAIDLENIDDADLASAVRSLRRHASEESREMIQTSIGEYIDPELPPNQWDTGGLLAWGQRRFRLSMTQNQLRKMEPHDIERAFLEAAEAHYEQVNLDGVAVYLAPHYPHTALAEWARTKFAIEIDDAEVKDKPRNEISSLLHKRVREAYSQREINYPVESCLERAIGDGGTDGAIAADAIVRWANSKFQVNWSLADAQGRTVVEVRDQLVKLNKEFFDGRLAAEIDANIPGKSDEEAIAWAKTRFARAWNERRFGEHPGPIREALLEQGRGMLRWELTRLEQFVLLRIYDQAWKDHLLEMDHLMDAIKQRPLGGDQSHPQSQYAIEGRELFSQMWARISGRVTDVVFKVRSVPGAEGGEGAKPMTLGPRVTGSVSYTHSDSTGAGFAGVAAAASADQQAAMRAQNVEQKIETIRRETPKVGRNDPCPCGSGKKYKQCHGR